MQRHLTAATLAALTLTGCAQALDYATTHDDGPTPGNCASYAPLFARYGLPVATFEHIAWRESGCNPAVTVFDSDDSGGGLLGLNLKGSMAGYWRDLCGLTLANVTNADTNIRCAAAAYHQLGMRPWST
ncbi:MAG TPA: hypothetical protein VGF22_18300 [Acidimicrobiales bacterium]